MPNQQYVQLVQPQQQLMKTQQGQYIVVNQQPGQIIQQPGRIIQQGIPLQQLNMSPGSAQPQMYTILSPQHTIASPLGSPVLNAAPTTIVRSAHQTSVIKQNQAFAPLVVKQSPNSDYVMSSPTPSRRVSESAKTEETLKSPSSRSNLETLSLLAEAADSMGYMKQEKNETLPVTDSAITAVKYEKLDEPTPTVTSPTTATPTTTTPTPTTGATKKRGRPKGLTKAVLEERKKNEAQKPETKKTKPKAKAAPKKPRLPKQASAKEGSKAAEETRKRAQQAMREMESSSSDSSTESDTSEASESSDEDRVAKIRPSGQKAQPQKRRKSTSKPGPTSPKKSDDKKLRKTVEKSPEKSKRRQSVASDKVARRESISSNLSNPFEVEQPAAKARRDSLTSKTISKRPQQAEREVTKVDDLKWSIKTLSKKDFLASMRIQERPAVIGWQLGQLARAVDKAVAEKDIESLSRKLVGCCYIKDGAPISIPDEINGKNRDSALCAAAKVRAEDGGPALINALCGIGGADPAQRTTKNENTALHIAAEQGIPGNVSALLGFKAPVNWRNGNNVTALHLAVELAAKWEKFAKSSGAEEFRQNYDNAYSCVELLLAAGADIYPEIVQQAGTTEVADLIHHYDMTINNEVYNFIKRSMGKCSLNVHNQLLSAVTCVPADQNILEIVIPEMENLKPNCFLMLFAVHGDYFGFGPDFQRLDNLRLSGNPCLVTDVVWHKPRVGNTHKEVNQSIDGLVSIGRKGPFEPGKVLETYQTQEYDTHFVTVLDYVPYRKNKISLSILPAHWSKDKIFIRVYPCELCMPNQFKNRNPEIPRVMDKLGASHSAMEEEVRRAREKWRKELKKECEILLEGKSVKSGR